MSLIYSIHCDLKDGVPPLGGESPSCHLYCAFHRLFCCSVKIALSGWCSISMANGSSMLHLPAVIGFSLLSDRQMIQFQNPISAFIFQTSSGTNSWKLGFLRRDSEVVINMQQVHQGVLWDHYPWRGIERRWRERKGRGGNKQNWEESKVRLWCSLKKGLIHPTVALKLVVPFWDEVGFVSLSILVIACGLPWEDGVTLGKHGSL